MARQNTFAMSRDGFEAVVRRTDGLRPVAESVGKGATVVPGLLRIEEAAEWLGLSKRKTYELLSRAEIQSVYIGRSRRITVAALERFVAGLSGIRD
jgi:excisionase family DNA binding protein